MAYNIMFTLENHPYEFLIILGIVVGLITYKLW